MKVVQKYNNIFFNVSLLIFIIMSASSLPALDIGKYFICNKSRLWLEGTSTLKDFSCTTVSITGQAIVDSVPGFTNIKNGQDTTTQLFVEATFKIKTKMLDCGHDSINEDMNEALKANQFPVISFELKNAVVLSINNSRNETKVRVNGILTVAGISKSTELTVFISEYDNNTKYRIQGIAEINMKDFNIEPPSAFFGLIVADEKLKLNLDLFVANSQLSLN